MSTDTSEEPDVALIGAGIMSATIGTLLKELDPSLTIALFESLGAPAKESSQAWNNAGTGHAANCELNYTSQRPDGSVDISKALNVNTQFDVSRQFWSYLVTKGQISDPNEFIHSVPHMSFVWGQSNVAFLKNRFEAMSAHHCFEGMRYSEDPGQIGEWAPLLMDGRTGDQPIAATWVGSGTDVDFGSLTRKLFYGLDAQPGFTSDYNMKVTDIERQSDGRWRLTLRHQVTSLKRVVTAKFVFVGAGGGALKLLQQSKIPEAQGYGGFPVSGLWLRCDLASVQKRHHAKVYGKPASGSPPMSVPHLDTRVIDGEESLLFGPYAGFSTKFLKSGSYADLFRSIRARNIPPLLSVGAHEMGLTKYLITEVLKSEHRKFKSLKEFFPAAREQQWTTVVAGQRVQIIRPGDKRAGVLEFGTELVGSADHSIIGLLGASPGASTAAHIAVGVVEQCFSEELESQGWRERLEAIIPTYGIDLATDADALRETRARTADVLRIERDIPESSGPGSAAAQTLPGQS
jgi:malate dehydrogenase (quinone)